MMPENNRPYHLVLLGATGFTGQFVARYLMRTYGLNEDLRWAIAGRNLAKLQQLRSELGQAELPILTADSSDAGSLDHLTQQTKVLCTTVGPYAKYGTETVAACVRNGAHYCDITGEIPWMRRMIDAHHEAAKAKKLKLVHTCGFDSIPSDFGVLFLQQHAQERYGAYCQHIKLGLKGASGGFSGSTIASLLNVIDETAADTTGYKVLFNPYGLNPRDQMDGPDQADLRRVVYDPDFGSWTCPFVMAAINTRVVRRSHALLGRPYGLNFRYQEVTLTGGGLPGRLKGYAASLPLRLIFSAKPGTLVRKVVDRLRPQPGQGPSAATLDKGFWVYEQVGLLPGGQRIRAQIKGDRDPGYGSTSKMLAEAAVSLALDELPPYCGVLTPATALGKALLMRLQANAGVEFRLQHNES